MINFTKWWSEKELVLIETYVLNFDFSTTWESLPTLFNPYYLIGIPKLSTSPGETPTRLSFNY